MDSGVQVTETAQGDRGVLKVVMEVESVVLLGFLGFLPGCFEELAEPLQQAAGGVQDLVQQGGGVRMRLEPAGESEERVDVDVDAGAVSVVGDVRGSWARGASAWVWTGARGRWTSRERAAARVG